MAACTADRKEEGLRTIAADSLHRYVSVVSRGMDHPPDDSSGSLIPSVITLELVYELLLKTREYPGGLRRRFSLLRVPS